MFDFSLTSPISILFGQTENASTTAASFFGAAWDSISEIGAVASLLGIAVSVVGLWLAVSAARHARIAANEARDASENTRTELKKYDSALALSRTIVKILEIRKLVDSGTFAIIADCCQDQKLELISIRKALESINSKQKAIITSVISSLSTIQKAVEGHKDPSGQSVELKKSVSRIAESLQELLSEIRT